jgi:hypothetical protein
MGKSRSPTAGYILAAVLGAAVGGIAVAVVTRAIPGMMSRMMWNVMGDMMMRMGGKGCDPEEMWKRMMGGFGEAASESA